MKIFTRQGRALLLSAVLVVIVAVGVSYGNGDNPSELVGHWIHYEGAVEDFPEDIELFKDGTGIVDKMGVTWKAENKRFRYISSRRGGAADYNVSGYELILVYDEEHSARFIKKENLEEYKKTREEEERMKEEEERMKAERLKKERRKEEERRIKELSGYFTDSRNGQKYRTVKIGGKTWMAENLNYQTGKSWCYDNADFNCVKYGRLYDWNTAKTVCPTGWHLPSRVEWGQLGQTVGGRMKKWDNGTIDWYGAGKKLKSKIGWDQGNGTDDYGFSALPSGFRDLNDGKFYCLGDEKRADFGMWWTASEREKSEAYLFKMGYNKYNNSVFDLLDSYGDKGLGISVRCIAD